MNSSNPAIPNRLYGEQTVCIEMSLLACACFIQT